MKCGVQSRAKLSLVGRDGSNSLVKPVNDDISLPWVDKARGKPQEFACSTGCFGGPQVDRYLNQVE